MLLCQFARPIIDSQARLGGMRLCRCDIFSRSIDTGYARAKPRQWFAEQPSAAADIECGLACKRLHRLLVRPEMQVDLPPDKAQPHRVQLVQHRA